MADKDPLELDITLALQKIFAQTARMEQRFARASKKMENDFRAANAKAARSMDQVQEAIGRTGRSLSGLRNILIGALSAREIVAYADAWTIAENKIAAAAQVAGISARSLSAINDIATETRASIGSTADLYAKLLQSTKGVAKSEQEVARATAIVNKAFKAGGAAASEQAAGILQLAQALSSGVLQGDELRSLRENAPLLAKAIADAFGVTVGQLKDLGAEGQLTSDKVFGAILAAQPEIEAAFAKTNATIGEGFTRLRNALTEYIGRADDTIGATRKIADALTFLADNIDGVVTAATILGASFLGRGLTPLLASLVPLLGGATAALAGLSAGARATAVGMTALRGAIGLLGGPVGATLVALTALPLMVQTSSEKVAGMAQASRDAVTALDAYATASQRATDEQEKLGGQVSTTTLEILEQSRTQLKEALRALKESAGSTLSDLKGQGLFDLDNLTQVADDIRRAINLDPLGNDFLAGIEEGLRGLRQGTGDATAIADQMARLATIGDEVLPFVERFTAALAAGDQGALAQVQGELVRLAETLGGFEAELAAVQAAASDEARVAAFKALRDRILEAAQAGDVLRQTQIAAIREQLAAYGLQKTQIDAIEAALVGNNEQVQKIRDRLNEGADAAGELGAAAGQIDFSNGAATAGAMADQLRRAVNAAMDLRTQSIQGVERARIEYEFRDDPVRKAAELAAADFDRKSPVPPGADSTVLNFREAQRRATIANAAEEERYRQKIIASNEALRSRGGGGGGGSTTEDRPFFEVSQEQIDRLNAQIAAIGQTAGRTAELYAKTEMLNEAKRRGLDLDAVQAETGKTLRQEIDAQAATIGRLVDKKDELAERSQFVNGLMQDFRQGLVDAIVDGESFIGTLEGIARALAKALLQAALFGEGPFATLWGGIKGVGLLTGWDKGGYTGPGGKHDPAGIVHRGEYVFSADAVKRIGVPNLDAMHRRLKGFREGGFVGSAPAVPMAQAAPVTVAPVVKVVVLDDKRKLGEFLQSAEGERAVIAALRKNRDAL
ncbi:tape measure protein [Albidovulum sediminis]|uniref:Tape measure protein n=1 Tax=Albidovulum sediminis TaxID=3066345 RepID=A0ABT2NH76_9RHOB|nr:tape measure protein [Defluviimonas sediminis]MCT8328270.1 tape measure protein [Defluviimonas sediminis]